MIFNEIFGAYTRAIGSIINEAIEKSQLSWATITQIISDNAFKESPDYIREMINCPDEKNRFFLIEKNLSTRMYNSSISKPYKRPITEFELRWLKTISMDPRIKLFCDDFPNLDNVEPLFNLNDVVYYDQDLTSDNFEDSSYIANFRLILDAIKNKNSIRYTNSKDETFIVSPMKLEYSQKDNRFRLVYLQNGEQKIKYERLSYITCVNIIKQADLKQEKPQPNLDKIVLEIADEKNAMERVCLSFSHLERTSERIDKTHYRLTITFDKSDEKEMIIRIMSFGSYVKVAEPENIKKQICSRIQEQINKLTYF